MMPRRYCSFKICGNPIISVFPLDTLVMAVSSKECKVHAKGGMPRFVVTQAKNLAAEDWPLAPSLSPEELKAHEFKFTCSTIFKKTTNTLTSYELENQRSWQWPTHVIIGTSTPYAYCFDLHNGNEDIPSMKYNTVVSTTCVRENGSFIIFGCSDGKVRMFDGRIRNNKCQQTIEAHTGSVFNISISSSGFSLVSCGLSAKKLNPYDPKSPVKYHKDPMIRVIDLRTMKHTTAIPLEPQTLPKTVRFLYEFSSCKAPSMIQYDDNTLLILLTNGLVQSVDARNIDDVSNSQMFYGLDQEDLGNSSTPVNLGISGSAELVAVSTSAGALNQFYRNVDPNVPESSRKCINYDSVPTNLPPAYPKPERSFDVNSEILAGQFVFNYKKAQFPLLSSFLSTPKILDKKFMLTSTRRISEEIKKDLVYHDFIGSVPNKMGFKPNTMIYGSNAKKAYAVCDPRRTEEGGTQADDNDSTSVHVFDVAVKHRLLKSPRGGFGSISSKYAYYNQTPYVSFENNVINSYVNPVLNTLYMIDKIRLAAIQAQTTTYHQVNAFSLWGELGFLFHMMNKVSSEKSDVPKIVSANNFQLSLRQNSEVLALGLIENSGQPLDPQVTVQAFVKFLFSQLQREYEKGRQFDPSTSFAKGKSTENLSRLVNNSTSAEENSKSSSKVNTTSSVVDEIFGYCTIVNTTFLQSNTVENGTPIRSTTLEITYPTTAPAPRNPKAVKKKQLSSFSAILLNSFVKESFMRGWCEASKSYEPFKQSRTISSMSKVT